MYKVEKRMQLKTSGNDILVTALTTQPGQWPRNASSAGAELQNTQFIIWGKTCRPHQATHVPPALLSKFLSLCLDKFYQEPSENYHEHRVTGTIGQMQTGAKERGGILVQDKDN